MKKWLQKGLMISVAVLTFGLIAPDHAIWQQHESGKAPSYEPASHHAFAEQFQEVYIEPKVAMQQSKVHLFKEQAKEQAYMKFGSRIAPKIGNEFEAHILPKIEEAIDMTLAQLGDETLQQLTITERPSGNYAERIFHIKNSVTNADVLRFHVRTENRLDSGYYYNFHYHTAEDQFMTHIELGEIHWSKNKPPKWLS